MLRIGGARHVGAFRLFFLGGIKVAGHCGPLAGRPPWGAARCSPGPQHPLNILAPEEGGGWLPGVQGTPIYILQNKPLVALIILKTYVGVLKEKIFSPWGFPSQQPGLGAGWGRSGLRNFFHVLHTYLDSP